METKLGKLGKSDWKKAFVIFVLSVVTTIVGDAIIQAYTTGDFYFANIHWAEIGGAIFTAIIVYVQKQLITNSEDKILTKEPKTKYKS